MCSCLLYFRNIKRHLNRVRRCFFNHEKFVSLLGIPENPQRPNHVFTLCLILVEKVGASETTSPTEQKGDPCVYVSISLHSTAKLRVANTCHRIP